MPELPEVETACRGIAPHLTDRRIKDVLIRNKALRWPVTDSLPEVLSGQMVRAVCRRGKFILIRLDRGHLMIHLGMSGSLRMVTAKVPPRLHDHVDFVLSSNLILRFHDPRRFGSIFWFTHAPEQHPLLAGLGPEPLSGEFDETYLYRRSRKRIQAVKSFIMNSQVVVGIGNIYANEALFDAGIRPGIAAGRLSRARCGTLARSIKSVLANAIEMGGTTLRDFVDGDGNPGYFQQTLNVYGRKDQPCRVCAEPVRSRVIGQRASYYCASCQR